ncbi:hypothetical protein EZS27_014197 [termite gut metagenome]|uniref:Uncharacterized protein n=1 Tax=termite gut metagenome TaxID=433724 RepID=A0A5J4RV59_9ZZZZ
MINTTHINRKIKQNPAKRHGAAGSNPTAGTND